MWMSQLNKLPPPIGNLKQMMWINDNIDQQAWDSHPVYVTQEAASWGNQVKTIKYIYQVWDKQDVNPGVHFRILYFSN